MNKQEFLSELAKSLTGLPKDDIEERIEFYSEMIDDRIEEGKTEENAVAEIGTVEEVVDQILADTSLVKILTKKMKPERKTKTWEIILLVLGFPLWFPLVVTALVLLLVAYILIWVIVIVCYSVELAFLASAAGGIIGFFAYLFMGGSVIPYLAVGLLGAGFGILFYYVCVLATKGTLKFSKTIFLKIKKAVIKGGNKNEQI